MNTLTSGTAIAWTHFLSSHWHGLLSGSTLTSIPAYLTFLPEGARIFSGSFRPPPLAVVARSPDRATRRDRRSPGKVGRGDLRSKAVAWSGDRATTRAAESVFPPQFATLPESAHAPGAPEKHR